MSGLTLQGRDKRALAALSVAGIISLAVYFWPSSEARPAGNVAVIGAALAEKRLARVRELAAAVPAREEAFKKASADLAEREKGLIKADTAAQAQAQLLEIIRRVTRRQAPPVEIRSSDIGLVRPFGPDYGEAVISVQFECRIDQLVNLLADLTSQPEMVATSELRISSGSEKQKSVNVRLSVSGLVPRSLVPEKKGPLF